jgi:hypothetical protein
MRDAELGRSIFLGLGVLLMTTSLGMAVRKARRLARWTRVEATVIGHRVRHAVRKGRRRTFHHPLVRYVAAGQEHVHESSVSTSQPRREVGATVALRYDPHVPADACIDEFREAHFVALVVGGIGLVFTAVGLWLKGS